MTAITNKLWAMNLKHFKNDRKVSNQNMECDNSVTTYSCSFITL